ncbi:MAG: hypothetical protein HUJ68_02125 [Clostridia bacterium]|nr:hypothetical protein [Clostridia bacterium]
MIIQKKTKCPHCNKEMFFPAVLGNRGLAANIVNLQTSEDIEKRNVVIGGPSEAAYIKVCTSCGYIGFFSKDIVDKNGKL